MAAGGRAGSAPGKGRGRLPVAFVLDAVEDLQEHGAFFGARVRHYPVQELLEPLHSLLESRLGRLLVKVEPREHQEELDDVLRLTPQVELLEELQARDIVAGFGTSHLLKELPWGVPLEPGGLRDWVHRRHASEENNHSAKPVLSAPELFLD